MTMRRPSNLFLFDKGAIIMMILLLIINSIECASVINQDIVDGQNENLDEASGVWLATVCVSVALVVCGVVLIFNCTDFCQKHSGFKDFDNDVFTTEDGLSPVAAQAEFTMYPPAESTPDSISATPVVFEPLPDVSSIMPQKRPGQNASCMRPRVLQDTYRSDSVDSLDDVVQRDSIQDKIKLQNLLTNSRQDIPRGQLQYIKELGSGWFGKILQGEGHGILPGHKKTKVVIQMLKEESDTSEQLAFLQEAAPYRDTDHQNVLSLIGQCVDTAPFLTILELCPFGDLKTYLRSHRVAMESFNEKGLLLKFACDMAAGLQALHQEGFIHRDFATRNCLLASDLSVKVGDYGISEETFKEDYYHDRNGDALPIRWLSPESIHVSQDDVTIKRITKEANIWAYGVALWEVLTFGALPYADLSNNHVVRLVVLEKSVKLPKPDVNLNNLDRLHKLLQLCWSDPEQRPSLRELRIMLLHLLSRREEQNPTAFDVKWNQLMPRQSPRAMRANPPEGRFSQSHGIPNGSVHTVSVSTPGTGSSHTFGGLANAPSVLAGEDLDDDEDLAELNASKLGLAGSHGSMSKAGLSLEQELKKSRKSPVGDQVTSPVNTLSLEAEFSAANMAASFQPDAVSTPDDLEDKSLGQNLPEVDIESETKPSMLGEDVLSPIRSDSEEQSRTDTDIIQNKTSETESQSEIANHNENNVPHSDAPNSPIKNGKLDFTTSTPKKAEGTEPDMFVTAAGGSTLQASTETSSQVTDTYHTAPLHSSSQSSIERSLSLDYEDRSFMAPGKFADLLQTVAMTTSVDDEMLDTSNESSPQIFGLSEEDIFKSPIKEEPEVNLHREHMNTSELLDSITEHSASGEDTPRNTPTPPVVTSAVPLLETSNLSTESESKEASDHEATESPEEQTSKDNSNEALPDQIQSTEDQA